MSKVVRFECDYTEGAHQRIIQALAASNMEQCCGYSEDEHCARARELIKNECGCPDADVHFLVGGTQANLTVIASILRPHQGVLCADSGHINCHETGAVEATGHKVLPLPHVNGKISASQVRSYCAAHWSDAAHEHLVQPGMVYISLPTEYGTMYSKAELAELYAACRENGLYLFIDGARLGYGLASDPELSLSDLPKLCDVFYIGGTKQGFLFGEAVVIVNDALKKDFRYMIKRSGGMLAKGRLLGVQYEVMFADGLYGALAAHAVEQAGRIRTALLAKGIELLIDSPTNQLFPILTKSQRAALEEKYVFCYWEAVNETRDALRICTSWATKTESVDALIEDINRL